MTPTKMRPFVDVISLDAALEILRNTGTPITRTETVALEHANGRVLASAIVARADVPPFSRAGMDGYAVRSADTRGASKAAPRTLKLTGTLFTGEVSPLTINAGECLEISTGAPMPDGADAVVMVEETDAHGTDVRVFAEMRPQQNVGKRGADIRAGEVVVASGELVNSSRVGAIAAVGQTQVDVYKQPRVAILSTGNEVVEPGRPLRPGEIYDVNRFTIAAVVADNGGSPVSYPPEPDSLESLSAALERCLENDVVVFSGGSSVGERDLIRDVIGARGRLLFHGVAIKPGKPTGLGIVDDKPVFAMPGYPASCLSNAHLLLAPLLRRLARLPASIAKTVSAPLAERISSPAQRHQFYTVRLVNGSAVPAFKASGDITSMSRADGYIEIPADVVSVEAGTSVVVTLFS